jgi:aryl-alcohol dehydrogenase-like predicted oxidoreductase
MIPKIPFGRTGHDSSRLIFGAAALGDVTQAEADEVLDTILKAGINHIDVAASYGDAEDRLAPFLQDHRNSFFVASKTADRDGTAARRSIERSLQRMQIEQMDLLQFHNLAQDEDWDTVMAPGGALEAAIKARDEGLIRHIGVTGHGTRICEMHLKSLARFDFESVLAPYNYSLMQDATYALEFEQLYALCEQRGVAMQSIKSIAMRRWRNGNVDHPQRRSWYEPFRDDDVIERAVHFVLRRDRLFLNTSSDTSLLPKLFAAVESFNHGVADDLDARVAADNAVSEPLFVRGVIDDVVA